MFVIAMLIYLGQLVGAATWFYWVSGILLFIEFLSYGIKLYNKGKESKK